MLMERWAALAELRAGRGLRGRATLAVLSRVALSGRGPSDGK